MEEDEIGWDRLDAKRYLTFSGAFLFSLDALMYPIDFLKTRQQFDLSKNAADRSIHSIFKAVYRNEGPIGFYRGFLANTVGAFPGQLVYFSCYEYVKAAGEAQLKFMRGSDESKFYDVWIINLSAGFAGDPCNPYPC